MALLGLAYPFLPMRLESHLLRAERCRLRFLRQFPHCYSRVVVARMGAVHDVAGAYYTQAQRFPVVMEMSPVYVGSWQRPSYHRQVP